MWETAEYPINVIQGQTLEEIFDFYEKEDGVKTPLNISDYNGIAHVRDKNGKFIASLTVRISGANRVTASLTDEETSAIRPGVYFWDLVMEAPDGSREKPFRGDFSVIRGATVHGDDGA
jgi:hypothetical protein